MSDVAASVASADVAVLLSRASSGAVPEQDYLTVRDDLVPLQQQTFRAYLADNELDAVCTRLRRSRRRWWARRRR